MSYIITYTFINGLYYTSFMIPLSGKKAVCSFPLFQLINHLAPVYYANKGRKFSRNV